MTVSRATSERHCCKSIISPAASQTIRMLPKCDGGPCGYVLCPGCDSSLGAFGSTSASCPKFEEFCVPTCAELGFPNNFTGLLHEVLLPQVWQKGEENWKVRSSWLISEMKSNMSTFETLVPSIIIELQNFDSPTEVSTTSPWPQHIPKATCGTLCSPAGVSHHLDHHPPSSASPWWPWHSGPSSWRYQPGSYVGSPDEVGRDLR